MIVQWLNVSLLKYDSKFMRFFYFLNRFNYFIPTPFPVQWRADLQEMTARTMLGVTWAIALHCLNGQEPETG